MSERQASSLKEGTKVGLAKLQLVQLGEEAASLLREIDGPSDVVQLHWARSSLPHLIRPAKQPFVEYGP